MIYEAVRICLIVGLGVLTGLSFHKRLRRMGFPMFGVFVLAADPRLYWAHYLVGLCLQRVGWWEGAGQHALWRPAWTLLPVVLFALLACWIISESGKLTMREGHPQAQQGELG